MKNKLKQIGGGPMFQKNRKTDAIRSLLKSWRVIGLLSPFLLFTLPSWANDVCRIPSEFHDSFDFAAGDVCDSNYHGELSAQGFMIEQRDANCLARIITHQVTLEFVNVNLDTGKTLIGAGPQTAI